MLRQAGYGRFVLAQHKEEAKLVWSIFYFFLQINRTSPIEAVYKQNEFKGHSLTAEAVQCPALSLQGIHNIHCGNGLPLGVFCVGNGISDYVLQEDLEHTAGLFIDHAADTLDTTTTSETTNGGLCDALNVVAENLPVPLSTSETLASQAFASETLAAKSLASLTKTLSSFASSYVRHACLLLWLFLCWNRVESEGSFYVLVAFNQKF